MARKNPSLAGRAALVVVLMVGFYALALAICGLLVLLCYLDLRDGHFFPRLWAFTLVVVGVLAWSLWPRRVTFPDPGVPVSRADQPRLWQLVDGIAEKVGQRPPQKIFILPTANAFVAHRGSRMGFGGERILGFGLPLLQVLSDAEVRSVIAHEFGHFHGGDTRLGPFLYRTRLAISRTVQNLEEADSWLDKPFVWYGSLFVRVTFEISRAQEYAADALAVRIVGLEPTQAALRRLHEVGPLFELYFAQEYLAMLGRGVRPPLMAGFGAYLRSPAVAAMQDKVGERAMTRRGRRNDSHPPLPLRLQAAAEVEDPGPEKSGGPPAAALLDDVDGLELAVGALATERDDLDRLPTVSWDETGEAVVGAWACFAFEEGRKLPATNIEDLGARAADFAAVARANNPEMEREHLRAAGAWMFGCCLGSALFEAGFEVEYAPGDAIEVVRGEHRFRPHVTTRQILGGSFDDADWRARCRRAGVEGLVVCGPEMPLPSRGRSAG